MRKDELVPNPAGSAVILVCGAALFFAMCLPWFDPGSGRPSDPDPFFKAMRWSWIAPVAVSAIYCRWNGRRFGHLLVYSAAIGFTIALTFRSSFLLNVVPMAAGAFLISLAIEAASRFLLGYVRVFNTHPHCRHCGYSISGLTEPRCPECGSPFRREQLEPGYVPASPPFWHRRTTIVLMLVLLAVLVLPTGYRTYAFRECAAEAGHMAEIDWRKGGATWPLSWAEYKALSVDQRQRVNDLREKRHPDPATGLRIQLSMRNDWWGRTWRQHYRAAIEQKLREAGKAPPSFAPSTAKLRVIISTDIGGSDPDDFQSMVHYLVYADRFETEGLIASPPGAGRVQHVLEVIDAYEHDYPRLEAHSSAFPAPAALREVTRQGHTDPAPQAGYSRPTEGSDWIIRQARGLDERPLYVLVWGSITDLAQAVHDAPEIKPALRVYSIGSWNTAQDPHARDYLHSHHKDLWWIESDTTFRGMYIGGEQSANLGNQAFVEAHVKGHGALGDLFWSKKRDIKMGDTPSVLYLLWGYADTPFADHWGGRFAPSSDPRRPNCWTDLRDPALKEPPTCFGAKTVNQWRRDYLRDWQTRMEWIRDDGRN